MADGHFLIYNLPAEFVAKVRDLVREHGGRSVHDLISAIDGEDVVGDLEGQVEILKEQLEENKVNAEELQKAEDIVHEIRERSEGIVEELECLKLKLVEIIEKSEDLA